MGLNPTQPGTLKGKAGGGGHRNPPKHIWQFSGCLQLLVLCFEGPASFKTVQETGRQLELRAGQLANRLSTRWTAEEAVSEIPGQRTQVPWQEGTVIIFSDT